MLKFDFAKHKRLSTRREIQAVFQSGQQLTQGAISLRYVFNTLNHFRLGIIIPKRYSVKAVDRNRLKRIVREQCRLRQNQIKPMDCVILLRQPYRGNIEEIQRCLIALLNQLAR